MNGTATTIKTQKSQTSLGGSVPEGEDEEAGDDEDGSEYDEDVVTGVSPPSIVEHLCRLKQRGVIIFTCRGQHITAVAGQLLHSNTSDGHENSCVFTSRR